MLNNKLTLFFKINMKRSALKLKILSFGVYLNQLITNSMTCN